MKHIAITGGIGSGKSYVCHLLRNHGISVYDCDDAAKRLYYTDSQLQEELKELVGNDVYIGNKLQKRILAEFLLTSEANKQAVNDVVHPAVARDFLKSGMEWLESAILFESGFYKRIHFDFIVCVSAPKQIRLERVMKRDGISEEKALEWIDSQWQQEKVEKMSDFIITNDGRQNLESQITHLLNSINIKHQTSIRNKSL